MADALKTDAHKVLSANEVHKIIKGASKGKYDENICRKMPRYGHGGSVYIYELRNEDDTDWKVDGANWNNNGKRVLKVSNRKTQYIRYYFNLRVGTRQFTDKYTKYVTLRLEFNEKYRFAVIQYHGDKDAQTPLPHGNSKRDKAFFRTTPSTVKKLHDSIRILDPKSSYDKTLEDVSGQFESQKQLEETTFFSLPRDLKQAQNIKHSFALSQRVSYDETFSIQELGVQEFQDTLFVVTIFPEFYAIFGHPSAIALANRLIGRSAKDRTLRQIMAYDTTFNVGNYYLSTLVMRNTELDDDPIFPVIYMIHERKLEFTHTQNWLMYINAKLKLKDIQNIPIVTDREKGIVNAIMSVIPPSNMVFCTNHILRDVEHFLHTNAGTIGDFQGYSHHVQMLLQCVTEDEFNDTLVSIRTKWSKKFLEYFSKQLEHDLRHHCCRFNTDRYSAFDNDWKVTNNISESFHAMIKHETKWKELPVDALFLALYKLQRYRLFEFNRGYKEEGKFSTKSEFKNLKLSLKLNGVEPIPLEATVLRIKKNVASLPKIKSSKTYRMSQRAMANICLKQKYVSYDPYSSNYIIRSPFHNNFSNVWMHNKKWLCSCKSTGKCYHKIAVEVLTTGEEGSDNHKYHLSLLSRKRFGESKGGRKAPRDRDVDHVSVIAAPDSIEVDKIVNESTLIQPKNVIVPKKTARKSVHKTRESKIAVLKAFKPLYTGDRPSYHNDATSIEIQNTPDMFEIHQFQGIESLEPKKEISNFVIDDAILLFIRQHRLNERISYIDSFHYNVVALHKYVSETFLQFYGRIQALNTDVMLVNINLDPKHGFHWVLGVILFKTKHIIIMDSMRFGHTVYQTIFENLRKLVVWIYAFANERVDFYRDWKFVVSTDSGVQKNGYDCGLFTICNAYAITRQQRYFQLESEAGRHWVRYVLSKYSGNPATHVLYPFVNQTEITNAVGLYEERRESCSVNFDIEFRDTEEITFNCYGENFNELILCTSDNCPGYDEPRAPFAVCVSCRNYFHLNCFKFEDNDRYYKCETCSQNSNNNL